MDFDASSNQSDDVKSTISSVSGLSNYQDEFTDLRHLVDPEKYAANLVERDQTSTPVNDSGCDLQYEDRIADLSYQLQSTLKKNEQYKNELFNLEIKFEVKYHDKIEKLLQVNNKLEIELANANEQIQRLIKNYASKNYFKSNKDSNFIILENKYHQLSLEHSNLGKKYAETSKAKTELELSYQKLRIDFSDVKLEVETKNVCVQQLKEKIAQQFVEIQMITKSRNLTNQALNEKNAELEQIRNMLEWYKTQLEIIQNEKKCVVEDISKYKTEILSKTEKIDSLSLELKSCENKFELYHLEILKEKQKLFQDLKQAKSSTQTTEVKSLSTFDQPTLTFYESSIEDLKTELKSIKNYMKDQEELIKKINKENSNLVSRCVATQKTLQNKILEIEEFELNQQRLKSEIKLFNDNQIQNYKEIELLKNENARLETQILGCKEEKYFVDTSIKTVRKQFSLFLKQYNDIKNELLAKNKQIMNLQNEKQELFMNNNWKVCELEKTKIKEHQIENLKKDIIAKEKSINELLAKINTAEVSLQTKNEVITNLQIDHQNEIERYDGVLLEYKQMFEENQMKMGNLEETIGATKLLTKDLKDNLNILKNELKKRDLEILKLQDDNKNFLKKIEEMKNEKNIVTHDKATSTYEIKCDFQKQDVETMTDFFNLSLETNGVYKINQTVQTEENDALLILNTCEKSKTVDIASKFKRLSARVKNLETKVVESKKDLNTLVIEKMVLDKDKNELSAMLQVKALELKEQQKKYERNYRTLLRKVREHMKGRNTAEKHNKYLQDLYNHLCEENNSLNLSLSSKTNENDQNKTLLTDFIKINEKMKKELRELEKKLKLSEICTKCMEFDTVRERLNNLEEFLNDIKNEKQSLEDLVIKKDSILLDLQEKVHELQCQISTLTTEKYNSLRKIEELQITQNQSLVEKECFLQQFEDTQLKLEELSTLLEDERHLNAKKDQDIFTLKNKLREFEDKLAFVIKDKDSLIISQQTLTEEMTFLKSENDKKDSFKEKQCEQHQKIIDEFKYHLKEAHAELSAINGDKFFIQRLCNDLKVALKSYVSQNQILKEKIDLLSENRQDSLNSRLSLPDLPSLQSFDENLVNNLLQETRVVPTSRPLTEIQLSLDTLRKEIFILQEQISKKNLRAT